MTHFAPSVERFATEMTFAVQSYDLDAAGFASERAYQRWLVSLRDRLLGSGATLNLTSHSLLVSSQISYVQPLWRGDRVLGRIWLTNLGQTRWTVQVRFSHGLSGDLIATAQQVGHFLSSDSLTPQPIPEADLTAYWEYQWQRGS